jgi:acetylornithine deacetylase
VSDETPLPDGDVIDRERLVDDLRAMVRIPSVTGSEEEVAAWAADALRELGLAVETIRPDLAIVSADPAWPGEEMSGAPCPS